MWARDSRRVRLLLAGAAGWLALAGCASPSPRPHGPPRPPPRPPAPVVEAGEPPSPCARLPEQSETSALFDAFFRAHAQGRIDPDLIDAHGGPVPQTPIATELVCPRSVAVQQELAPGRTLVGLRVSAGSTERDIVETQVVLTGHGDGVRIEAESLARLRGDLQAFLLRRLLRDHAEIEQLAAIDVPLEDDFPDPEGVSPRRRARERHNLRLAFARQSTGTVLCVLDARADSASTRSWCWRDDERIDRVVAGEPMIVDEAVQVQLVLVPIAPARRADVVEVRLPGLEARSVGVVTVRPAPIVPAWQGRAREGVVLAGRVAPRPGPWTALVAVEQPPSWIAVLGAVPWLRATPVPSPRDQAATSITSDLGETRRWLALHTGTGWAFSEALDRPGPDGMTSWDGVEPAPDGNFVAWSSDFGGGRGSARRHVLRADGDRLVEEGVSLVGRAQAWWNGEAPEDPVAARLGPRLDPGGARYRVAFRRHQESTEAAHVTPDFQPIPGRPRVPLDPARLGDGVE